ncbi:MAG: hypothetical protein ACLR23_16045 [Clostridia bacterium]
MKRAKYSKLLAVLLTAAMMLTMLPTVAFAEDIESSPVDSCTVTDGCTLKAGHEGGLRYRGDRRGDAERDDRVLARPERH